MTTVTTDEDAKKNIAENLGRLLHEREMSQIELAQITGDTTMRISYYVRGARLPGAGALARLAEALEVSMESLITSPKKNPRRRLAS